MTNPPQESATLYHACRLTCSGWRDGYKHGNSDANPASGVPDKNVKVEPGIRAVSVPLVVVKQLEEALVEFIGQQMRVDGGKSKVFEEPMLLGKAALASLRAVREGK